MLPRLSRPAEPAPFLYRPPPGAPVGAEHAGLLVELGLQIRIGLPVAELGRDPEVLSGLGAGNLVQDEAPIRRPVGAPAGGSAHPYQQLLLAGAGCRLAVQVERAVPAGRIQDARAIRGPDRQGLGAGIGRQARRHLPAGPPAPTRPGPCRLDGYRTREPSGDQIGRFSVPGSDVRREGTCRRVSSTHTSGSPASGSSRSNAILV